MKNEVRHFFRQLTDFLFRRRSPALTTAKIGLKLTAIGAVGGWFINAKYKGDGGIWELSYHTSSTPQFLSSASVLFGIIFIFVGVVWEVFRYRNELRLLERRKTIVIEQRGLVDTKDQPLAEQVKQDKKVFVDPIVVDIRERLIDNKVTRPDLALEKVLNLPLSLKERTNSLAASDIEIIYGGIVPVPFAFTTGYLLDDESKIDVYDWDRDEPIWRTLSEGDDDEVFKVDIDKTGNGKAAVVAISFSYPVDKTAIDIAFPSITKHHLSLEDKDRNNHWSKQKQNRLAGEFFEYCKKLQGMGIEHIHLVLAAQNSVAFRFGQSYDKRNLPPITVYQYERSDPIKYPWGVLLPQIPDRKPSCIMLESESAA
jgi:hypothetical protein